MPLRVQPNLTGHYVGANDDNAAVQNFVNANNSAGTTTFAANTVASGGGGFTGGGTTCP